MNINDYDKLIADFRKTGDAQAKAKRIEYTESRGNEDVFTNFKETAKDIEMDDLKVLYTFMKKHWSSIVNYIKTGQVYSDEPIEERIQDLIQYLELTYARIMEKKLSKPKSQRPRFSEEKPQVINKDTMAELAEKNRG